MSSVTNRGRAEPPTAIDMLFAASALVHTKTHSEMSILDVQDYPKGVVPIRFPNRD